MYERKLLFRESMNMAGAGGGMVRYPKVSKLM